ncbi:Protein CBG07855 [Caenorhabditis briggsae]|uniref:Protein CBG07855 n=1 Tax=Caenorhabditis briggsae TaxID=6238 RepID=A8X5A1_CAEBR|nr:Protein CBG07855 [Caenorhabditis briggsae]CAP27800.2 Protein CBG07855 [Caenorhabditis briggsae]
MNTQWIHDVLHYDPHLSAVSFLLNSIYLIVLVQKSMRTSSTNIILLAIAISNLAYMTYPIIDALKDIYNSMKPCILPDSYAYVIFSWISYTVQDDVRRCEAFLFLAMASIRTFVLKYPMKNSATTKLVFLNTIVYVTSALPSGIFYVLHSYDIAWLVEVNFADFVFALGFLTSLMTLTHFPICLAMSTQYRSTVLELLRLKNNSGTTQIIHAFESSSILPDSYAYVFFDWIFFSLQDDVRRCDPFLGLAMASIRTFVLKFPMRSRTATSVSFGWKNCLIAFLFSSIISFARFLGTDIAYVGNIEWECYEESNPNKTSFDLYIMVPSTLFEWNGFLYSKIYMVMNAVFSKKLCNH